MSYDVKYIGYVELDIADTMWPSGLCRGGVQTEPRRLGRVAIRGTGPLTTQHHCCPNSRANCWPKRKVSPSVRG